ITAWEPNRHLGTVEKPPKLAIDYFIEGRGGKTVLRLVHSGFDTGADWEDEYMESYKRGWPFMLENLRHYLERHRGTPRQVAWLRLKVTLPVGDIWERLFSPKGLLRRGTLEAAKPGQRYAFEAATGDRFEGVVRFHRPPISFCGTVENRNNALLWVNLEKAGGGTDIWIWLSAYGLPQPEVGSFQQRGQSLLEGLFPEKATGEKSS
ncbi:MAG: SRPBCC domain-containing protein, partial [Terriglobia bacterium]